MCKALRGVFYTIFSVGLYKKHPDFSVGVLGLFCGAFGVGLLLGGRGRLRGRCRFGGIGGEVGADAISLCAFVTLGVEISCSHFAIVCLDTPSSAAKASCVSPFRFLASAICFPDNMHYTSPFYYLLLILIKSNSSHTFKHFYDYFMLTP